MTVEEFSNEFDTLLNSYAHSPQFGEQSFQTDINLNEYEKSVFLTEAQEDIVKDLYSGKYSTDSFEANEQIRRELDTLVEQKDYVINADRNDSEQSAEKLDDARYNHTVFKLDPGLLYIVYEQVSWSTDNNCLASLIADVYPVTHDEYWRVRNNPFKGPNTKRVLRLDKGNSEVELVSKNSIGKYTIRYIKKPDPIVLTNLSDETIDNVSTPQTCKLNKSLHRDILDRAVRLALASRTINVSNKGEKKD